MIVVGHDAATRLPPGISLAGGRSLLALLLTPLMGPGQQHHAEDEYREQEGGCSQQDRDIPEGCRIPSLMCRRARGRQKAYRHAGSIDAVARAARAPQSLIRCLRSLGGSW